MNRPIRAALLATLVPVTALASADPIPPIPPNPLLPYSAVTTSPARIKPGQYTTITVTSGNYGGDGYLSLTWGDNSGGFGAWTWSGGCAPIYPNAPDAPLVRRHAYRYPGTYTIRYSYTLNCHGYDIPPHGPYRATATLVVEPGPPAPSNGPERPFFYDFDVHTNLTHQRRDGATVFQSSPYDIDGYLTRLVYSWGDGTPGKVFTFPLSKCVDPPDHWPQTGNDDPDNPPSYESVVHKYARKGTYTATVTMTTTGCDGRHAQTARATTKVTIR